MQDQVYQDKVQKRVVKMSADFPELEIQQLHKEVKEVHSFIDHTLLACDATEAAITKLCNEAKEHKFASVCVNGCYCELAHSILKDTEVRTCCVIGFPLGAMTTKAKVFETKDLLENGADEIDMVINCGWMKDHKYLLVKEEIEQIAAVCHQFGKILKVIIEATCLETEDLIIDACLLSQAAGADFVKTSTGMHKNGGAKAEHVKLMRQTVGKGMGVKAAGGIHSFEEAVLMIEAGANRLGCSAGMKIQDQCDACKGDFKAAIEKATEQLKKLDKK